MGAALLLLKPIPQQLHRTVTCTLPSCCCHISRPHSVMCAGQNHHTHRSLKNLDLGGNDAGPEGALALAEALAMHPSLTMLELGYNPLGPKGAATIAGECAMCCMLCYVCCVRAGGAGQGSRSLSGLITRMRSWAAAQLEFDYNGSVLPQTDSMPSCIVLPVGCAWCVMAACLQAPSSLRQNWRCSSWGGAKWGVVRVHAQLLTS